MAGTLTVAVAEPPAETTAAARALRTAPPIDYIVEGDGDDMARLFINHRQGQRVTPGDILGAVAGESGMPGRLVGSIDMYDGYTFVDVPVRYADEVLKAMAMPESRAETSMWRRLTGEDRPPEPGQSHGIKFGNDIPKLRKQQENRQGFPTAFLTICDLQACYSAQFSLKKSTISAAFGGQPFKCFWWQDVQLPTPISPVLSL